MHIEEPSQEELAAFIGKDPKYYIEVFQEMEQKQRSIFNVYAFFGGLLWIFYRKMYAYGFIILAFLVAEEFLETYLAEVFHLSPDIIKVVDNVMSLFYFVAISYFGNWLYKKQAYKKIKEIKQKYNTQEEVLLHLKKEGGVSYVPLFIVFALLILLIYLYKLTGKI